jgi:hypothetical protein
MNAGAIPARSAMELTFFPPEVGSWYTLTAAGPSVIWIHVITVEEDNRPGLGLDYWVKTEQWIDGDSKIIWAGYAQRYWGVLFSIHDVVKLEDEEFQAILALTQ